MPRQKPLHSREHPEHDGMCRLEIVVDTDSELREVQGTGRSTGRRYVSSVAYKRWYSTAIRSQVKRSCTRS